MLHLVLVNKELIQKQTYLFHLYHHASVSQLANRSSKEGMSRTVMLYYNAFCILSFVSIFCLLFHLLIGLYFHHACSHVLIGYVFGLLQW
jgi:hypothetical protein